MEVGDSLLLSYRHDSVSTSEQPNEQEVASQVAERGSEGPSFASAAPDVLLIINLATPSFIIATMNSLSIDRMSFEAGLPL